MAEENKGQNGVPGSSDGEGRQTSPRRTRIAPLDGGVAGGSGATPRPTGDLTLDAANALAGNFLFLIAV